MSLQIIKPRNIAYVSSNAVVESYPAYSSATSYAVDDNVIFENNIYSCKVASTGKQPNTSTEWYREQAVNPYALLDGQSTARTETTGTYVGEFTFEKCDTLAVIDATGKVLTIEELDDNDVVIDTHTHVITEIDDATGWYDFFLQDIPESATGNFEQTLTLDYVQKVRIIVTGNNPSIGFLISGRIEAFGCTQWGASTPIVNPTPPIKNGFGNVTLVKGNYQETMDLDVTYNTSDYSQINRRINKLRDTAIYVSGAKHIDALKMFGYIAHFVPVLTGELESDASFSIESFVKGNN